MEKAGRGPGTTPGCSLPPIPGESSGLLAAAVATARELFGPRRATTLRRCRSLRPAALPAPPRAPYSALDFAESADTQCVPQHVVADLHPPVVLRRLFQLSHLRLARLRSRRRRCRRSGRTTMQQGREWRREGARRRDRRQRRRGGGGGQLQGFSYPENSKVFILKLLVWPRDGKVLSMENYRTKLVTQENTAMSEGKNK